MKSKLKKLLPKIIGYILTVVLFWSIAAWVISQNDPELSLVAAVAILSGPYAGLVWFW